jgi:hypothetical protein
MRYDTIELGKQYVVALAPTGAIAAREFSFPEIAMDSGID